MSRGSRARRALRVGRAAGMPLARLVALGLVVSIGPPHLGAQSRVLASLDTTLVTVGDRVTLTVSVEHLVDAAVSWPDSLSLEPFEVLDAEIIPTVSRGDRATSTVRLSLAAFELGQLEIPSFEVTVLGPEGASEVLETDRFAIEVVTVGADDTDDIREIRGPFDIPISAIRVALGGLLILLLTVAAYVAFGRLRPSSASQATATPAPLPRPAHEVALEALDRLEASTLLERGQVKEYHIEVSDILRRYLEARFGVAALEMTTWEVLTGLERAGVDPRYREGLGSFLQPCDMVKFAKVRPSVADSLAVLALGRDLVKRSIIPSSQTPSGPGQENELVLDSDVVGTSRTEAPSKGVGV